MKKNIIIDAGPTNERIDAVMKITNMSTGALGSIVADTILEQFDEQVENIFYISTKLSYKPRIKSKKVKFLQVESTDDLINTLETLFSTYRIDAIVHSAAVGDYKGRYVIRAEDIVEEIINSDFTTLSKDGQREKLLSIFKSPSAICNDDTKISSYEENLMVMLDLTPKVISRIKALSPNTMLIGFKLLEGVSEQELFDVASRLLKKNNADYIIANLLDKIGGGKHFAMVIDKDGIVTKCETKAEIATTIANLIFK
ncbi:MAG: hypothetical protein IJ272_06465 [Clostridia bacterium]|nr:hypothetical protein [Clostridia bacterium]